MECIERGLNPLTTNLVVADANRTEKTIYLAVFFGQIQKTGLVFNRALVQTGHK